MSTLPQAYDIGEAPETFYEEFSQQLASLDRWFAEGRDALGHRAVGNQQPYYIVYHDRNNREVLSRYGDLCARLMNAWYGERTPGARGPAGMGRSKWRSCRATFTITRFGRPSCVGGAGRSTVRAFGCRSFTPIALLTPRLTLRGLVSDRFIEGPRDLGRMGRRRHGHPTRRVGLSRGRHGSHLHQAREPAAGAGAGGGLGPSGNDRHADDRLFSFGGRLRIGGSAGQLPRAPRPASGHRCVLFRPQPSRDRDGFARAGSRSRPTDRVVSRYTLQVSARARLDVRGDRAGRSDLSDRLGHR